MPPASSIRVFLAQAALIGALTTAVGCDGSDDSPRSENPRQDADAPGAPLDAAPPPHLAEPPADPRAALIAALAHGLIAQDTDTNDRLRAVLRTAGVAPASQVLVFSKTSMQDRLIAPNHPRAIYFNDDCYIGYVPGGLLEYADADPDPAVGTGLFALDLRDTDHPRLTTDTTCHNCHTGSRTGNRSGLLVRSVFPDADGFPITSAGSTVVGHHTPLDKRWGGWYVTGTTGQTTHRGNQTASALPNGGTDLDPALGTNVTDLSPYFNTDRYLEPTSDVVALMALEHQARMHNLLTQGSAIVNEQTQRSRALADSLGEPFDAAASDTLTRVIDSTAEHIVRHLLFCDEITLTDPVVGGPAFQAAFRANRREDAAGRSLKDFDLQTRLFRYRCSYMVYSRAFGLMPDLLKDAVVSKLRAVLAGENDDPAYGHLDADEREAIRGILIETTNWYADPVEPRLP